MTNDPPPTTPALDPALLELAGSQHDVLTTRQLRSAGLDSRRLVELVAAGTLLHPGRGVYLVSDRSQPDAAGRHRQLVAAAGLLYDDLVLVGASAVLAHGIPMWGVDLARPALRRPVDRSGGVACFWVRGDAGAAVPTDWGLASPLPEALAQLAVDHGIVPGVVSADAALREGRLTPSDLETAVQVVASWRHGSRAVAMHTFVDGRRESVGESRCAVQLAMAGIDVVPQVEIRTPGGRLVGRVDFLVDGTRVVVEFDGKVKYADGDAAVLWAEKRREDELRALGYVVVRVTWADLERPGAVAAKVRAALRAAA